jgi:hypothetical protein
MRRRFSKATTFTDHHLYERLWICHDASSAVLLCRHAAMGSGWVGGRDGWSEKGGGEEEKAQSRPKRHHSSACGRIPCAQLHRSPFVPRAESGQGDADRQRLSVEAPGDMGNFHPNTVARSLLTYAKHSRQLRPLYAKVSGEDVDRPATPAKETRGVDPQDLPALARRSSAHRHAWRQGGCSRTGKRIASSWRSWVGGGLCWGWPIRGRPTPPHASGLGVSQVDGFGSPSVSHVTVVIFLEFFAWGLVTVILPEVGG